MSILWFAVRRPWLKRRMMRPVMHHVDGVSIAVVPNVFDPVILRSGAFLARVVATSSTAEPAPSLPTGGRYTALDMGTGSGMGAIFAARRGYRVVGVDVNPDAVRCARANVLLNDLQDRIEIRHGDLFAPVTGERFDLVVFNPPFFRGIPRNPADAAWRSTDVVERFASGLPNALHPSGRALILFSSDGDVRPLCHALEAQGFVVRLVAQRNLGNEVMSVYCAQRPEATP